MPAPGRTVMEGSGAVGQASGLSSLPILNSKSSTVGVPARPAMSSMIPLMPFE